MALKKDFKNALINVAGAYYKVVQVTIKPKTEIAFVFCAFASQSESVPLWGNEFKCAYDMAASNPIAQAYVHLKTLPDFADAVDC